MIETLAGSRTALLTAAETSRTLSRAGAAD